MARIICISGYKDSGKTTLARDIIRRLGERGYRVAFLKHAHEKVLGSPSSTDTGKVISEGIPSFLIGEDGLILEMPGYDLDEKFLKGSFFQNFDILVVEGGKELKLPKIWTGEIEEDIDYPGIIACYNCSSNVKGVRKFKTGEENELSDLVSGYVDRSCTGIEIYSHGKNIGLKQFVADFIIGGIIGMLSSLKGISDLYDISIQIRRKRND